MPRIVTGIETGELYNEGIPILVRYAHPNPLPPIAPYATPNDVPTPMRHTIRLCHGNGFTTRDLALIYELPEQWVRLFVMPDTF